MGSTRQSQTANNIVVEMDSTRQSQTVNIVVEMGSTPQPAADKTVERDRFIQWLSLARPSRTDKAQTQVINTRVKVILLSSASNKANKNGYNNPYITLRKRPPPPNPPASPTPHPPTQKKERKKEAEWRLFLLNIKASISNGFCSAIGKCQILTALMQSRIQRYSFAGDIELCTGICLGDVHTHPHALHQSQTRSTCSPKFRQ